MIDRSLPLGTIFPAPEKIETFLVGNPRCAHCAGHHPVNFDCVKYRKETMDRQFKEALAAMSPAPEKKEETHMTSERMSDERLDRLHMDANSTFAPGHGCWIKGEPATIIRKVELKQLLAEIDALRADLAAARMERDNAKAFEVTQVQRAEIAEDALSLAVAERDRAREALGKFTASVEAEAREAFCTVGGQERWPADWMENDPNGFANWVAARAALTAPADAETR